MNGSMTPTVRERREYRGMGQRELGRWAATHQPHVARYERGRFTPEHEQAERLAEALGITVFDLRQYPTPHDG